MIQINKSYEESERGYDVDKTEENTYAANVYAQYAQACTGMGNVPFVLAELD